MFTTNEVSQYIRLTLKEHKLTHLQITWVPETIESYLGLARIRKNEIKLNKQILRTFKCFEEVFKHEVAHFLQYRDNGNQFFRKNGRWILHGKDFKEQCRKLGIPARTVIPI